MKSMTGFGRAHVASTAGVFEVEVKSVNHKGLDVKLTVPAALSALEPLLIEVVRTHVERGRVDVRVTLQGAVRTSTAMVHPLVERLHSMMVMVDDVVAGLKQRAIAIPPWSDAALREIALAEVDHAMRDRRNQFDEGSAPVDAAALDAAKDAVGAAIAALVHMRTAEGAALRNVIDAELGRARWLCASVAKHTALAPERLRQRLHDRIKDLDVNIEPTRLIAEVALMAERVDVSEELERLTIHLQHFEALLGVDEPSGRRLDFLCQELMREANTTASKCQDAQTAHEIVELKACIERMREQIQNVE